MLQFLSQVFLLLAIYSRVSGGNQSDLAVTRAFYFMTILLLRLCLEKSMIVLNSLNGFSKPPIPSIVVYRSTSPPVFLDEFSIYLENVIMCPEPLIIAGTSISIWTWCIVTIQEDSKSYWKLLVSLSGHVLDPVITRSADDQILGPISTSLRSSDYRMVECFVYFPSPVLSKESVSFLKLKGIDINMLIRYYVVHCV